MALRPATTALPLLPPKSLPTAQIVSVRVMSSKQHSHQMNRHTPTQMTPTMFQEQANIRYKCMTQQAAQSVFGPLANTGVQIAQEGPNIAALFNYLDHCAKMKRATTFPATAQTITKTRALPQAFPGKKWIGTGESRMKQHPTFGGQGAPPPPLAEGEKEEFEKERQRIKQEFVQKRRTKEHESSSHLMLPPPIPFQPTPARGFAQYAGTKPQFNIKALTPLSPAVTSDPKPPQAITAQTNTKAATVATLPAREGTAKCVRKNTGPLNSASEATPEKGKRKRTWNIETTTAASEPPEKRIRR